jgi:hypothetical protein
VDVSKEARAHAMSPRLKAGNYVIPHPALAGYEWVARTGNVHQEGDHTIPYQPGGTLAIGSFLNEHTMFPNSANDDQVDTTTQADKWLFLQEEFTEENFADTGEY